MREDCLPVDCLVDEDPEDAHGAAHEPCYDDEPSEGLVEGTGVSELDFGPYDFTRDRRMFGIRTRFDEGYAGGYGMFEALSIFRIVGDVLVPVLDVPIAVHKMTAGGWNSDGSRQHDLCQADLGLFPHARGTTTHDLVLRSPRARTGLEFRWDRACRAYVCR